MLFNPLGCVESDSASVIFNTLVFFRVSSPLFWAPFPRSRFINLSVFYDLSAALQTACCLRLFLFPMRLLLYCPLLVITLSLQLRTFQLLQLWLWSCVLKWTVERLLSRSSLRGLFRLHLLQLGLFFRLLGL